jgi:hypothetical protein
MMDEENSQETVQPTDIDILFGRDDASIKHVGNVCLRPVSPRIQGAASRPASLEESFPKGPGGTNNQVRRNISQETECPQR